MIWICPFCQIKYHDSIGQFQLQQHLTVNLCIENTSSANLKLLIKYKEKEIELVTLNLKLQQQSTNQPTMMQSKTTPSRSLSDVNKQAVLMSQPPISPKREEVNKIRNFGNENCQMLTDKLLSDLEEKYGESDEIYQLLMIDFLNLIHFNPEYPENKNLKSIPDSVENINVYFGGKWQEIDTQLVISEYFNGNLKRIQKFRPDSKLVEQIRTSFATHSHDIIADFTYLIQMGEQPSPFHPLA